VFFGLSQGGGDNRQQQSNDRDDHEQFDEGKRFFAHNYSPVLILLLQTLSIRKRAERPYFNPIF
jgi:hypothetical protein